VSTTESGVSFQGRRGSLLKSDIWTGSTIDWDVYAQDTDPWQVCWSGLSVCACGGLHVCACVCVCV
jgi:hypothetical protein